MAVYRRGSLPGSLPFGLAFGHALAMDSKPNSMLIAWTVAAKLRARPTTQGGSSDRGHGIELVVYARNRKNRIQRLEGFAADQFIEKVVPT